MTKPSAPRTIRPPKPITAAEKKFLKLLQQQYEADGEGISPLQGEALAAIAAEISRQGESGTDALRAVLQAVLGKKHDATLHTDLWEVMHETQEALSNVAPLSAQPTPKEGAAEMRARQHKASYNADAAEIALPMLPVLAAKAGLKR